MLNLDSAPPERLIARARNHIYLRPAPPLVPFIAHYTITHPARDGAPLYQGAALNLMPDLGGCFVYCTQEGEWARFWGAYTKAVPVTGDFDSGPVRFFVEFHPGGANHLLGISMREYADAMAPAGLVHRELHKHLEQAVRTAKNIGGLLAAVDAQFLALLAKAGGLHTAGKLIPLLAGLAGTSPVRELASATGYSERQLGRIFGGEVGVGVKTATRIVRLNRMLQFLQPGVPLALLAQQAGYYDQAHLDHDFKAICGVSPSEYLASVSDFYKEDYKF